MWSIRQSQSTIDRAPRFAMSAPRFAISAPRFAISAPRFAMFTPLPPAASGTADYAAALVADLGKLIKLEVLTGGSAPRFRPRESDVAVYQIADNPFHAPIYDLALERPGVVVLHEPNLHNVVAMRTIARGDERAYLREIAYELAGRDVDPSVDLVPSLQRPQPARFTLCRKLLDRSLACIVHSRYAESEVRMKGFRGPVAVIPHGAAVRTLSREHYRHALGIPAGVPVIGLFGYQREKKRELSCLAVFRDLLEHAPDAVLLSVGDQHPEIAFRENAARMGLVDRIRQTGFVDISDFDGYLAASDVVLNLREPTFGETSGTMMRAFGLGRAVIVSKTGACRELPDEVCVKIPSDEDEPQVLLEALKWLTADLDAAREIGRRAQCWVENECTWPAVARQYAEFLSSVAAGSFGSHVAGAKLSHDRIERYLTRWAAGGSPEALEYFRQHSSRLVRTVEHVPSGTARDRILEMGCYLQITPALDRLLGYGEVRGCYLGNTGEAQHRRVTADDGEVFDCNIDLFDAEVDSFPYPAGYFSTVLCCELLEHLRRDPMHMMFEIHRVLKNGGTLVLTTPNAVCLRALAASLEGMQPGLLNKYSRPDRDFDPGHFREYSPAEVMRLLTNAGFVVNSLETGAYGPETDSAWVSDVLRKHRLPETHRGECIFAIARKDRMPTNRYPDWLYE